MIKHRLIATLLVHDGDVVQTRRFRRTNMVGSAFTAVDFFNAWAVDEILVLNVSRTEEKQAVFETIVEGLSSRCFVPLTVGGKIRTLERVQHYTRAGADKVVINSHAVARPEFITEVADVYGSQCVVVSIDAAPDPSMPSGYQVRVDNGTQPTERDAIAWAREASQRGAGELLVNAIEHDGDKRGYDLALLKRVSEAVRIPVIAMGGVGNWDHLIEGISDGGADAVAAGNIFHYTEHSTKKAKEHLASHGLAVRNSAFYKVNMPKRPKYRGYKRV